MFSRTVTSVLTLCALFLSVAQVVVAQVTPNPASLLASKKILVINGTDAANTAHGASRRVLSQRLNQLKTTVGFQLDSVAGSATPPTDLSPYDIIVFNYWFHSGYVTNEVFQTGFLPFANAFKTWAKDATKRRGWLGMHSSAANEAGEWNWFRDSVASMRYALHGAGTPAGTIRRTLDTAVRNHPIMQGLPDTMRVSADEWYTFTLDAPTWPQVRVLYHLDESSLSTALEPGFSMPVHPMAWYREDAVTGNRFFYTGLIHQNPGGTTAFAEFYAGLVLRGLEYLAGYSPTSIATDGYNQSASQGFAVRDGTLMVTAAPGAGERYVVTLHETDGRVVFKARAEGTHTFRPEVLRKSGVYIARVSSSAGSFNRKIVVP
jgi:Trehalose utilisation